MCYGLLPPKEIGKLKPWQHTVHIDLIGPYTVTVKQQQLANQIVNTKLTLVYMTFIDLATGWFEIAEVPTHDLEEVKIGNKEYIDKTSARISQLFYNNGSEFKKDF